MNDAICGEESNLSGAGAAPKSADRRLVSKKTRFTLLAVLCAALFQCVQPTAVFGITNSLPPIQTVFIILLENYNWADVYGSSSAPYINNTLLPASSFCTQYYNPSNSHPSERNYIWLEAGTNLGIVTNNDPSINHQGTTNHLTFLLRNAGVSWKTYQEDIDGKTVPLTLTNLYVPRHCPFVFFDDITGTNNPNYSYGISHIRPYTELAGDLASNNVARYNFLTPNLCDDGHNACNPFNNNIEQADAWLSTEIPRITNSAAYQNNGAIFITWDEGVGMDGPIGMIVLSKLAKGNGYSNAVHYTHSSTVRTMQEIFGVFPLLADATNATDLSDLFLPPSSESINNYNGPPGLLLGLVSAGTAGMQFSVNGAVPGKSHVLQFSPDLVAWTNLFTNVPSSTNYNCADNSTNRSGGRGFYRVMRQP